MLPDDEGRKYQFIFVSSCGYLCGFFDPLTCENLYK